MATAGRGVRWIGHEEGMTLTVEQSGLGEMTQEEEEMTTVGGKGIEETTQLTARQTMREEERQEKTGRGNRGHCQQKEGAQEGQVAKKE